MQQTGYEQIIITAMTLMWMFFYWAIMIPIVFAEILISLKVLGSIVRLL